QDIFTKSAKQLAQESGGQMGVVGATMLRLKAYGSLAVSAVKGLLQGTKALIRKALGFFQKKDSAAAGQTTAEAGAAAQQTASAAKTASKGGKKKTVQSKA